MPPGLGAVLTRVGERAARLGEARQPAVAACGVSVLVLLGHLSGMGWATRGLPPWPQALTGSAVVVMLLCVAMTASCRTARVLLAGALSIPLLGMTYVPVLHVSAFGTMSLTLLGAAILVQTFPVAGGSVPRHVVVDAIGLVAAVPPLVALLALLFARPELTSLGSSPLSFYGAVSIALLTAAVLVREPRGTLGWIRRGADPGAVLLRRLVPATFVLLPLLALVRLGGQRFGWFGLDVGLAVMTAGAMIIVAVACLIVARQLRRSDQQRAAAMRALQVGNDELDREVRRRVDELSVARLSADLARDRERISADLHDLVIQRLYGAALSLQVRRGGTASMRDEVAEAAISAIDDAITELRGTIFNLRADTPLASLKKALADAVEVAEAAGFVSRLEVTGSLQSLSPAVTVHLTAVIREAVSNAARHSGGAWLTIKIVVTSEDVTLLVVDDGRGLDPEVEAPSGLRNIRARAVDVGGHATWAPNLPAGTRVTWVAPLRGCSPESHDRTNGGPVVAVPDEGRILDVAAFVRTLADAPRTGWNRWPAVAGHGPVAGTVHAGSIGTPAVDPLPAELARLARLLREGFAADRLAIVTEVDDEPDLLVLRWCEDFPDGSLGLRYHRDASLVARSLATDRCLTFTHVATASATGSQLFSLSDGSAMIIPLVTGIPGDRTSLAVTLLRDHDQPVFTSADTCVAQNLVRELRPLLLGEPGRRDDRDTSLVSAG